MATTTTISDYQRAIVATLRTWFGGRIAQVGAYQPLTVLGVAESGIETPALLVALAEIPYDDAVAQTPGRVALTAVVEIHALVGLTTPDLQLALTDLAAELLTVVRVAESGADRRGNRWGLGEAVGWPTAPRAIPAGFEPGVAGYDSWLVSFEQLVYVQQGASV